MKTTNQIFSSRKLRRESSEPLKVMRSAGLSPTATSSIIPKAKLSLYKCSFALIRQVYVSSSLANLYEGIRKKDWRLVYTGVPVLLYDKGSARSRAAPRVTFVLAERGTWSRQFQISERYWVDVFYIRNLFCLVEGYNRQPVKLQSVRTSVPHNVSFNWYVRWEFLGDFY